jgi:hypothetical protein
MVLLMKNSRPTLAPVVALYLLALAPAVRAEPTDRNAPAPALRYPSAFADYKPWQEIKPADWRAVNDGVRGASDAGGHAGSASPAALPPAASSATPKASAPIAPAGQGGHHGAKP